MELKNYWESLSKKQREEYATRAGTTYDYMRVHVIPGKKIPRKHLLEQLAPASNNEVSTIEAYQHFYPQLREEVDAA